MRRFFIVLVLFSFSHSGMTKAGEVCVFPLHFPIFQLGFPHDSFSQSPSCISLFKLGPGKPFQTHWSLHLLNGVKCPGYSTLFSISRLFTFAGAEIDALLRVPRTEEIRAISHISRLSVPLNREMWRGQGLQSQSQKCNEQMSCWSAPMAGRDREEGR